MAVYIRRANPLNELIGAVRKDGSNAIQILQGYPTLKANQKDLTVVAKYIIEWDKIDACRKGFLGYNQQQGQVFTQYNPYKFLFAGENVYATEYASEPFDVIQENCDQLIGEYKFAQITVQFKPKNEEAQGGLASPLIYTESAAAQTSITLMKNENLFWDAAQKEPVPPDKFPTKKTSRILWTLDYPDLPEMWDGWETMDGTTNSDSFTRKTLNLSFEPETLLVEGVEVTIGIGPDGTQQVSVRFSAMYNEFGWNLFQKTEGKDPVKIYDAAGDQVKPFPPVFNFSNTLPAI